jgi:hypothetical protein
MTEDNRIDIGENEWIKIEAAAFRRLVAHLRTRTDVQNLDLMNLAGFCRNCLSNWLQEAAQAQDCTLTREAARRHIYGMPYEDWKTRFQRETTVAMPATDHRG